MAVPMGRWEAAPGRQAPLAHRPARKPRVTRCHGRVRHPGPLTGAGQGPISGGPSSQPTAPPRQPLRPPELGGAAPGTGSSPAPPRLGRAHRAAALPPAALSRDCSHLSPQTPSSACSLPAAGSPHSSSPASTLPVPCPEELSTGTTGIGAMLPGAASKVPPIPSGTPSPRSPLPHWPLLEPALLHKAKATAVPRRAEHPLSHPPRPHADLEETKQKPGLLLQPPARPRPHLAAKRPRQSNPPGRQRAATSLRCPGTAPVRNGRWGSPEPSSPTENRCPSHGPGSASAGRPGHLCQATSSGDTAPSLSVTPSPSGTPCQRQSCIRLLLHCLEMQPWAAAQLQGRACCRGTSEGRGAVGRHRWMWQALPTLRSGDPSPTGPGPRTALSQLPPTKG